jgi:hypothetical protein
LAHRTPAHIESIQKAYRILEKRYATLNAAATPPIPTESQQVAGDEASGDQTSAGDRAPLE